MKIINKGLLVPFQQKHPKAKSWVTNWLDDTSSASWLTSHDVKLRYPSCSFLGNNRVIFNVRGNSYRLDTHIAYNTGIVWIDWIGTHAAYSRRK